jgi:hypothetical protein
MRIKKFNNFRINESKSEAAKLSGEVTLYRLTSHPVVDLSQPGEFYVSKRSDVNPDILDKKGKDLFLITVKCDSSNIDLDESEKEAAKLDCDCIVVIKDDKKCEVISVEPFNK